MNVKSYGIGLGLAALCAALYATQNHAPLTQKFILWTFTAPEGMIVVFSFILGLAVMALLSACSGWEAWGRHRRELARRDRRIEALEKEREAMLTAMKAAGTTEEEISFIEDGQKS